MRPNHLPARRLLLLAWVIPFIVSAEGAMAQDRASGTLEARVRALEEKVVALERRLGAGAEVRSAALDCTAFSVAFRARRTRLSITADGRMIGSYEQQGSPILTSLLRPGLNTISFAYASPGDADSLLQAYCTPPGADQRVEVLRFKPEPGALDARVVVNLTAGAR